MDFAGLLVIGGGIALFIKALRDRAAARTVPPPTRGALLPGVDLGVVHSNLATTDTWGARGIRQAQATGAVALAVLGTIGSIALTVASAIGWTAVFNTIGTVLQTIFSTSFSAFLGIFVIFIIAIIVAGNIFGALKGEQSRWSMRLNSLTGSYYQLNQWEFASIKGWLDAMKVPYTIEAFTDYRFDVKFYADSQWFVRHWQRYAVTNVQMDPKQWQALQLLARVGAIDYFQRAGHVVGMISVRWKTGRTWWGPNLAENLAVINDASSWVAVNHTALWDEFPLISGLGVAQASPSETVASAPKSIMATYSEAVGQMNGTPIIMQIQRNNHWCSIMAGISMVKYDEDPFLDDNPDRYGLALYERMGLSVEKDHVGYGGNGFFTFDQNYWGWKIVVNIMAVKAGDPLQSIVVVDGDGNVLERPSMPLPRKAA